MNPVHSPLMEAYDDEQKTKQLIVMRWIGVALLAIIVAGLAWEWLLREMVLMLVDRALKVGTIILCIGVAFFFAKIGQGLADYIRSRAK